MFTNEVRWCDVSTLHAGLGRIRLLLPENSDEVASCVKSALEHGEQLFALGSGTNLLGSDDDFVCTALRLSASPQIAMDGRLLRCNGGVLGARLLKLAAEAGLGGAAALSGIPGTLGGMLAMNAGANGQEICEIVAWMRGISLVTGDEWRWQRGDGGWSYRTSPVPPDVCITEAALELRECSVNDELALIAQEQSRRRRVTPSWWSAGSVFRNPSPDLPAGRLLEEGGCKGLRSGVFMVSERHANWIVNAERRPGAAADALRLIDEMKARVAIPLKCEIRTVH